MEKRDLKAPVDPLDLLGEKAKMDLKVPQVPKDQRDLQVLKEHMETKVKPRTPWTPRTYRVFSA